MKIVVVTDLAAFAVYALATWPNPQRPGHWQAPWETHTASVVSGNTAFCRTLVPELPPDLPACVLAYETLDEAMDAHPSLPWHLLSVFDPNYPEQRLVAAVEAYQAEQLKALQS